MEERKTMAIVTQLNQTKYEAFRWRHNLSTPMKLALSVGIAVVIGLLAQIRITLPGNPIPITGQTFAVLIAGVLLGRLWGGISLAIYAALGWAGVPWFSGWTHGLGATGGYVIGFAMAALFLGYFTDKYIRSRSFFVMFGLMLFANFILIYIPGLLWLGLWLNLVLHKTVTIGAVLATGAVPFIFGDILKAAAAAGITRGITPKSAYANEVDKDAWKAWHIP
jgi:biotin transport system substrate-specific component